MSWLIFAFLSAIMAALVAIFGKMGLKNVDSTLATTIRSVITAGFLVSVSFFLKKFQGFSFKSFDQKDWLLIVLAGIAGALSRLFYFFCFKKRTSDKSGGDRSPQPDFCYYSSRSFFGRASWLANGFGRPFDGFGRHCHNFEINL